MINLLYDSEDNLITNMIADVLILPDIIKVKNRLLDGTYHIQSIGAASKNINITCYTSEAAKAVIDEAYIENIPVKLTRDGNYYTGLIIDAPTWQRFSKGSADTRLYTAKFTINVQSEGVVQL